jgi:hypothetical protein
VYGHHEKNSTVTTACAVMLAGVIWVLSVVATLGIGYIALLVHLSDECNKQHGKLVQGVIWYECVAAP